jgi:putative transposase
VLQRRLSRKKKGSKNRAKARLKVAKLHAKIADIRRDTTHKLTTRLIRENQAICLESLDVKRLMMTSSAGLCKQIADANWSEIVRQLEYKADWYGRKVVKIDKWYPSSKRCNDCGFTLEALDLGARRWVCPSCGVQHDRDVNAAKNILAVGRTVLACGGTVRPLPKSGGGRSRRSRNQPTGKKSKASSLLESHPR